MRCVKIFSLTRQTGLDVSKVYEANVDPYVDIVFNTGVEFPGSVLSLPEATKEKGIHDAGSSESDVACIKRRFQ